MSLVSDIWDGIKRFFSGVVDFIKKVIRGILNFFRDIVAWFKELRLNPKKDTPFIVKADKLKDLIDNAPVVDVGIFMGVYNEETNEITNYEIVVADALDEETSNTINKGKDGIVVLQ